ncbi:hypothetical protein [Qipengyuania qiaonensis]|uniref:DUF3618 domain-containing protein n=1 Tax=Qipengyuania qiaonensis TaxID=2867240 RepID=A0ABS7J647_9SPHN|nr:hypothetical protein [Qipengyuania qiaonensis]MBX7481349.1 hypothetical protein [Qipengyuania qiaonensis]
MTNAVESNVTPISAESNLSDEQKREQLRARIEAGEKRNAERTFADQAKDVVDGALEFTKRHPLAVAGGVVVAGLAIGAMTRRGRNIGRRGGVLAGIAADAMLAYGARMIDGVVDGAHYAGDRIEDFSDNATTAARGLRRDAAYKLDVAGDALRSSGRKAGRKSSRAYRSLRNRFTQ